MWWLKITQINDLDVPMVKIPMWVSLDNNQGVSGAVFILEALVRVLFACFWFLFVFMLYSASRGHQHYVVTPSTFKASHSGPSLSRDAPCLSDPLHLLSIQGSLSFHQAHLDHQTESQNISNLSSFSNLNSPLSYDIVTDFKE